ncbi:uncharacterized protein LOC115677641 isoform X2 [Syzygium oleosum]|uniref:uncharacterized protein LOC115677641 isoform X2 n=1 Tax=Syzygium oleosum TaxID=219896 RepID=UPI0024BABF05|nr:uncharacterized protein LOC115677641 isoform X2 [Syzygium oleosum]
MDSDFATKRWCHVGHEKPEAVARLQEGITVLLSRWRGLQLAVENQWGGPDSLRKSRQLAADILSCFACSKEALYVEDLENFLHECMLLSFNTEMEDGSIEEVAEQLMMLHAEYLQGHH